jgi:predicted ATPase
MARPSGIVTFLFTDIEGSTRRWESDPDVMRAALAAHDEVLRSAIEASEGWLFKHTGDGVCAAFVSPSAAVEAAVAAQRALELPVRMGMATGEAELRGDDYFGPALNRAARVMSAGHGGQVLVAESTAALVSDAGLLDLGERRLRDLSGAQRLFQVTGPELRRDFPPLRTLDAAPGNLPVQTTSLIGRDVDVAEISETVRVHRLVTLTGVGGVGKTRLALQVAADVLPDFADGVWLVELADVGDAEAVPAAVATVLGLTPQAGLAVIDGVAQSLGSRNALVVLDNCEHVLDSAADLAAAMLEAGTSVKVLATSREGLRVDGEHVWSVPSLDAGAGTNSAAAELFVERARAVDKSFEISGPDDASAVTEICERLDGIPLAIELAAARIVAMSPVDIRDRLGDRFRLLAGGRRGLERHQTLRHAVQWSYELLDNEERTVLQACSVFAGGFDLQAAVEIVGADRFDELHTLDVLDSLVRKSLVTVDRSAAHVRYAMLETIRQFGEEQLAASGDAAAYRDRHAAHCAQVAERCFKLWASPDQHASHTLFSAELPNVRAGFRWAADNDDLDTAATIAAKISVPAVCAMSFEPIGWCEELLPVATADRHRLLKYLYAGAALCAFAGRPEDAIRYGEKGRALEAGDDFDEVAHELETNGLIVGYLFTGQAQKYIALARDNANMPSDDLGLWAIGLVWVLTTVGEYDEAMRLADDMLAVAEASNVPGSISYALSAYGKAFTEADPPRAIAAHRRAVALAREAKNRLYEVTWSRELAGLEAAHGDPVTALDTIGEVIDAFHQIGDLANLAVTFGYLVLLFDRIDQPTAASTVLGAATRDPAAMAMVTELANTNAALQQLLGDVPYHDSVNTGAAMNTIQAVQFAHAEIHRIQHELGTTT